METIKKGKVKKYSELTSEEKKKRVEYNLKYKKRRRKEDEEFRTKLNNASKENYAKKKEQIEELNQIKKLLKKA